MKIFDINGFEKDGEINGTSYESFKHVGAAGQEIWFCAGATNNTALTTGAPSGNNIRVIPFIAPGRGGVLDRLAVNVTTNSAGSGIIGIYENTNDWTLYPSGLIYQTPQFTTGSNGTKVTSVTIRLNPGGLYWMAYWNNSGATLRALALGGIANLLGFKNSLPTTPNIGYAFGQNYPAGITPSLPSIYPLGAVPILAVPIPGLFYRYGA